MGSKGRDAVSGDYRRLRDNRWCSSQVQIQRTGNTYTDNASRMVSEGDRCGVAGACGYEPAEICFSLDGNVVRAEAGTGFYSKIDLGMEKGKAGEKYNIGGHNETPNIEIVNIIVETLQEMLLKSDPRYGNISKELITYVEDRKGHDRRYAIAPDKIKKELGWEPGTGFRDGIRKTAAWYLEHSEWMEHVRSGTYREK